MDKRMEQMLNERIADDEYSSMLRDRLQPFIVVTTNLNNDDRNDSGGGYDDEVEKKRGKDDVVVPQIIPCFCRTEETLYDDTESNNGTNVKKGKLAVTVLNNGDDDINSQKENENRIIDNDNLKTNINTKTGNGNYNGEKKYESNNNPTSSAKSGNENKKLLLEHPAVQGMKYISRVLAILNTFSSSLFGDDDDKVWNMLFDNASSGGDGDGDDPSDKIAAIDTASQYATTTTTTTSAISNIKINPNSISQIDATGSINSMDAARIGLFNQNI